MYALFFASRGAKVVVNDLGGSHTGNIYFVEMIIIILKKKKKKKN
jgi:hypothetical protein